MPRISWLHNNRTCHNCHVLWCRRSKIGKKREGQLCVRVNKSAMRACNFMASVKFSESLKSASSCFAKPPQARHPRVCVQLVVSCDAWGLWVVILALHSAPASHGIPNLDMNPDVGSTRAMVTFQLLGGNLPRSTGNFIRDFRSTRTQDPPRICLERLGTAIQFRYWHQYLNVCCYFHDT